MEEKNAKTPLEEQTESTAYHEAGHAVMLMIVNLKFQGVYVLPSEVIIDHNNEVRNYRDKMVGAVFYRCGSQFTRIWQKVMVNLAGLVAEDLLKKRCTDLSYVDCTDFDNMLRNVQTVCYSPEEGVLFLKWCHARATSLLSDHWAAAERIAAELLRKPDLLYREALDIFNAAPLRGTDARWEDPIIAP